MMKFALTLFAVVLIGAGCSSDKTASDQGQIRPNNDRGVVASPPRTNEPSTKQAKVLDLTFKDYSGNEVSLANFAGTPLVVNAWAIWCPFCVNELPDFAKVQSELGDSVKIIAINRSESRDRTDSYLTELGVRDGLTYWLDSGDTFYQAIGGFSMPETIFIDANGVMVDHKRGPMDADGLSKRIKDNFNI